MAKFMGGINSMPSLSRTKTQPLAVPRTTRRQETRVLTSGDAGFMIPLVAYPMLREDELRTGRYTISVEMMETAEILMNAVNLNVKAYLVPNLAFERFEGSIDQLNRSYEGQPSYDGGPVIPFYKTLSAPAAGAEWAIFKKLGMHVKPGTIANIAYLEAYQAIWNFRAQNRSPDIPLNTQTASSLRPAFWQHQNFAHIVPDFDQASIEGSVPIEIVGSSAQLPVKGIGVKGAFSSTAVAGIRETGGAAGGVSYPFAADLSNAGAAFIKGTASGTTGLPEIYAELEATGIMMSLSNIELAKQTQAFAKLRQQYAGHTDDWIIDLLMDGITIPEQAWKQPILLADKSTIFGMSKRYSSDADALTESVVNGATFIDLTIRCPRVPTGGVIMIVAEVTPEQMWERQADPYVHVTSVDGVPSYMSDFLDPEKVEVVTNGAVDVSHSAPTGVFGYAPLNWKWNHAAPKIGGKFFRPDTATPEFDETRQRIWACETVDPTLSANFYLCNNMNKKPFVESITDSFEFVVRGEAAIVGNTVFGPLLIEASDNYETIMGDVDLDRIDKAATAGTTPASAAPLAADHVGE